MRLDRMPRCNALVKTAVHIVLAKGRAVCIFLLGRLMLRGRCTAILVNDLAVGGNRHFHWLVKGGLVRGLGMVGLKLGVIHELLLHRKV